MEIIPKYSIFKFIKVTMHPVIINECYVYYDIIDKF